LNRGAGVEWLRFRVAGVIRVVRQPLEAMDRMVIRVGDGVVVELVDVGHHSPYA
jgi:hypothetical protein